MRAYVFISRNIICKYKKVYIYPAQKYNKRIAILIEIFDASSKKNLPIANCK